MFDEDQITVHIEKRGDAHIVAPEGDVDLGRSPTLRSRLKHVQSDKPARLIVDLSLVDYMDSSGVATLVEALQLARRNKTEMILCSMQERVRSIFEIARLDTVFKIVPDVESALLV